MYYICMFYKQPKHEQKYAILFMEYKMTQASSPDLHKGIKTLTKIKHYSTDNIDTGIAVIPNAFSSTRQ